MLFHPILNQIANLDMAFLVKPADEQRIEGQTAFFCPLCQKEEQRTDNRHQPSINGNPASRGQVCR